jgi:GrpB-like predicted nucleotidyltransferase (UPF0157 family)
MQYPVVIVDYDPAWPRLFETEKNKIAKLFGDQILSIEHVGSTAVPGLVAKPIIDIMIGVDSLEKGKTLCLPALQKLGYQYVAELEKEIPERYFLFRGSVEGHSHHIHITQPTTEFWIDHILFRDYLRRYPDVAREYGELKQQLAQQYRLERVEYGKAKTDFIENVLAKARILFQT